MNDDKMFFVGQKAFIHKNNEVLILKHKDLGLDFPGGKIQKGEDNFIESLKREVFEETSLKITVGSPFFVWSFNFRKDHIHSGKQTVLIGYACEFESGEVKLSDEHDFHQWVNKDNYMEVYEETDYFKALERYFQLGKCSRYD